VENAPDLVVNLRDGYVLRGDLGRAVRMVRTHGALSARSSEGILATSARPLPPAVRGDEVLGLVGVRPEHLLDRAADLRPAASPEDRAEQLARGSGYVTTGREDHSVDAEFLRRARPVVLSMEWFGVDAVRALLAAAAGARGGTAQATRIRDALQRADVLGGLSRNVDRLLPVVDSIGVPPLDLRVRNAERVVAGIGELAPLRALLPSLARPPRAPAPARRFAASRWRSGRSRTSSTRRSSRRRRTAFRIRATWRSRAAGSPPAARGCSAIPVRCCATPRWHRTCSARCSPSGSWRGASIPRSPPCSTTATSPRPRSSTCPASTASCSTGRSGREGFAASASGWRCARSPCRSTGGAARR
jgi:hypothetical protein